MFFIVFILILPHAQLNHESFQDRLVLAVIRNGRRFFRNALHVSQITDLRLGTYIWISGEEFALHLTREKIKKASTLQSLGNAAEII